MRINATPPSSGTFETFKNITEPKNNQQNFLAQPPSPIKANTISDSINISSKQNDTNKLIQAGLGITGSIAGVSALVFGKKILSAKNINEIKQEAAIGVDDSLQFIEHQYKKLIEKFPQDEAYYKQIAIDAGLKEGEEYRLFSIVGKTQLTDLLQNVNRKDFEVGKNFEGVKNLTYRINLHNHTQASDGKLSIKDFLEQAKEYADKVAAKNPNDSKPAFTVAITDHDIMDGGKEAIKIIAQDPYKYRNLRLVTGSEISLSHVDPKDVKSPLDFELLAYSVNPFNKEFGKFLETTRNNRNETAKVLLENINKKYPQLQLNWQEAEKFHPNLGKGTSNGSLWLAKDYAAFKNYLKFYVDKINTQILNTADKKLNTNEIMLKSADDFYLKMDQGLVRNNDMHKYFTEYGIEGFSPNSNPKLQSIFEQRPAKESFEFFDRKRDELLRDGSCMFNHKITVTPQDVFDAYRKSGDYGMFGVAHPGFINTNMYSDNVAAFCKQHPENTPILHLGWRLFKHLKEVGGDLFKCSEINYQSYGDTKNRAKWINFMEEIANLDDMKLLHAGGMDCHKNSLFLKHKFMTKEQAKELELFNVVGV